MADAHVGPEETETPKKRPKRGRKRERSRDESLRAHATGASCGCHRLKCFERTSSEERESLLEHFNSLVNKDAQDSLLSAMIEVQHVKRRRPRQQEAEATFHDHSYAYSVRVVRDRKAVKVPVCVKAMWSIFGIGKARLERVRSSLAKTGVPPINTQGKHSNRPLAFTDATIQSIIDHIRSFRGRQSHYSLHDSRKLYLPEDLNLCKMYRMYRELHPNVKVSRESYRKIFVERFNMSFGYPRKDTCSTCDKFNARLKDETVPAADLHQLEQDRQLHLRKAHTFYDRKRQAKETAQTHVHHSAVAFDFAKNLSCPNITTNDVYYRRQLSLYTFNVHCLEDDAVHLFCYDETGGRKGADDVTSMLNHYFMTILPPEISHLELFCDSCGGQNKNYTMIRFLHDIVVQKKRFAKVKLSFPIRGHSYMECDRDMAIINQKAAVETPEGWLEEFRSCRKKPSPFCVVEMELGMFMNVTDHLKPRYRASCPIPIRPLREIVFSQDNPQMIHYRESWNGTFHTTVLTKPVGRKTIIRQPALTPLYQERLSISEAKFRDLQVLKEFCSSEAREFFAGLPHAGQQDDLLESESESESEQSSHDY